ncbi:MAG: hypothetical protein KY395_06175 [Actinobacteria bacterium]|nr:hypothetical protein [Actinomycetota bacterium]
MNIRFTEPRVDDDLPRVETIAVTPDGTTLVAGGNFLQADGKRRVQVALVDLASRPARVLDWQTDRYDTRDPVTGELKCAQGHDTHIRDIDVSPDGRYFVVVTTGGYQRGQLCDTAARWEIATRGSGIEPTWVAHDGGDSFTGVAITGPAVYVGGHQRWMNNPFPGGEFNGGAEGPGSVARRGIAALDPLNGLPLAWNPGRDRGEGAWALVSSADGLWVGSDTDRLGGEYHGKIAFLPLSQGTPAATFAMPTLPADLYTMRLDGTILRRSFDGNVAGHPSTLQSAVQWSGVQGAFALDHRVYTGQDDGRLMMRTFDGTRFGAPAEVNLRGLTTEHFPVADTTGMFYDAGRLYYTIAGDARLFYRYFTAAADIADDVVGADTFVASGEGDGLDWSRVNGMTLGSGRVYWAEDGHLHTIGFSNGRPKPGTHSVVSTEADLASRGMFLLPSPAPVPPLAPTPSSPPTTSPPAPGLLVAGPTSKAPERSGYWMVGSDGRVYSFGDAHHFGDAVGRLGTAKAVDLEPTPSRDGYWILDDAGRVYAFGTARYLGGAQFITNLNAPTTSLSATPSGRGYWIFTTTGQTLAFGDARHYGDMSRTTLNGPVLDSIRTGSGNGYYMVASDGGIFTFGDARFYGSMGNQRLNAPVQSLVPDGDGRGYWLVASDGGIFSFDAPFRGSMGDRVLNKPVTGMVPLGNGYLMVGADGGIFNFSDRPFVGSLGDRPPAWPIVSVAAVD